MTTDLASNLDDDLDAGLDDDLDAGPTDSATVDGGRQASDGPSNFYPDVYAFVTDFLARVYAHEVADRQTSWRWCSRWHHHTEAVARLEACWKAWEVLRQDPGTGASVWFRDHADPCMSALTGPEGPFTRCSDTTHHCPPALPVDPLFARTH